MPSGITTFTAAGGRGAPECRESSSARTSRTTAAIAAAICGFWHVRGYWSEGREHLAAALAAGMPVLAILAVLAVPDATKTAA